MFEYGEWQLLKSRLCDLCVKSSTLPTMILSHRNSIYVVISSVWFFVFTRKFFCTLKRRVESEARDKVRRRHGDLFLRRDEGSLLTRTDGNVNETIGVVYQNVYAEQKNTGYRSKRGWRKKIRCFLLSRWVLTTSVPLNFCNIALTLHSWRTTAGCA